MAGAKALAGRSTRVAAYALCYADGRALLARTGPADRPTWTLPGGALDFGADPTDGLRQLVLDDTGLVVRLGAVLGADCVLLERPATARRRAHLTSVVRLVLAGEVVGGLAPDGRAGGAVPVERVPVEALSDRRCAELVDTALAWRAARLAGPAGLPG